MTRLHGSYGAANPSLDEEKAAIRARMRGLRPRLKRERPNGAELAADFLGDLRLGGRGVVAAYLAMRSELDPAPLIERFTMSGWRACLPRAEERTAPLAFFSREGDLTPDSFGMPAPSGDRLIPDIVIAPLLAFDRAGRRLGYGAGCYDRTIRNLRASGGVRVIGLAYAGQEVERVPTDEGDEPLDAILTDSGLIEVVRARS